MPPLYRVIKGIKRAVLHSKEKELVLSLPDNEKCEIIVGYAKPLGIKTFIETGTLYGDMLELVKNDFDELYSIELDKKLYIKAHQRFTDDPKIKLLNGDSGKVLPELLKRINDRAVFWLDAHYAGVGFAEGNKDTPIIEELGAIANHEIKDHIILIDDMHSFTGKNDYPTVDGVNKFVVGLFPNHKVEIKDEIMRIYI